MSKIYNLAWLKGFGKKTIIHPTSDIHHIVVSEGTYKMDNIDVYGYRFGKPYRIHKYQELTHSETLKQIYHLIGADKIASFIKHSKGQHLYDVFTGTYSNSSHKFHKVNQLAVCKDGRIRSIVLADGSYSVVDTLQPEDFL